MGEETCDVGKGGGDGELFDCNICLEMVKDPVVTCCGHLFCWPCLYKWLQSNANNTSKGCPVCKGKITIESVIPIYGRGRGCGGNNNNHIHEDEEESTLNIPPRPTARRVSEEEDGDEEDEDEEEDEDFPMIVRARARQSRTTRMIAIMERMIQHLAVQIDSRVVSDDVDG